MGMSFTVNWQNYNYIRIHHECEDGIEQSVRKTTSWHHQACRVMINGDREGCIFLSNPNTYNGLLFLLTTKYRTFYYIQSNEIQKSID